MLRRLQKDWNQFVFAQVMQHTRQQMAEHTGPFLVKVSVYHIGPAQDYDGFVGSCKPVFDALVNNRFMPDDSRRHIRRQYEEVLVPKKEHTGTLIQIWPDKLTELERVDA